MAMTREDVLAGVKALAVQALPNAEVKRNVDRPSTIPPGGMLIIRDGDPGDPEVVLGVRAWSYEHKIDLEFALRPGGTSADLDIMMRTFGEAVSADPTLSGRCEWLELVAPFVDSANQPGTAGVVWADAGLIAIYTTASPL